MLGAAHFGDEFLEARVILFAGFRFQAAGYINPVGMNDTDCFRDIFDLEAAGENYAMSGGSAPGKVPVVILAGAAILACASGVEEEGEDAGKTIERSKREVGVDAKGFDDGKGTGDARDDIRVFVALKLCGVEAPESAQGIDIGGLGIDEDTDGFDFR